MKQRIYVDTSVIGGYYDDEFHKDTLLFFERVFKQDIIILVSDLLQAVLARAPEFERKLA
jgi:hypothetical protein